MNKDVQQAIVHALQDLCSRNEGARTFFEWAASRQKDGYVTSIDVFERKSLMDRASCIELAKELSRIGCGQYIVGRRGSKTRVRWDYGLRSIARAAVGQENKLRAVDPELEAELEDQPHHVSPSSSDIGTASTYEPMTIAEAKRRLAASLGVPVDSIDITVRG